MLLLFTFHQPCVVMLKGQHLAFCNQLYDLLCFTRAQLSFCRIYSRRIRTVQNNYTKQDSVFCLQSSGNQHDLEKGTRCWKWCPNHYCLYTALHRTLSGNKMSESKYFLTHLCFARLCEKSNFVKDIVFVTSAFAQLFDLYRIQKKIELQAATCGVQA